jgi:lipoate-protein ligase A
MLIVHSRNTDVFFNLALEDFLLDRVAEFGRALILYRDRDAVVVGKNQNPWRECDVAGIVRDGVALARRSSGGGTVYHDEGNLNYGLILPRTEYNLDAQFEWVIGVLRDLGVDAIRSGTNSLSAHGLKFSGNAFCLRRNGALHHGTFLVASDLERLNRYLKPAMPQVQTHAVASVPARVGNLSDMVPGLTLKRVEDALSSAFGAAERRTDADFDWADFADHLTRHRDWDWVYGHTPRFSVQVDGSTVTVESGRIIEPLERAGERFG